MNTAVRLCVFTLILPWVFPFTVYAQGNAVHRASAHPKEQVIFESEKKILNPVVLPLSILVELSLYDHGQLIKCQQDKTQRRKNISRHFLASSMALNKDSAKDMVVQATSSCFMGAHNTTYWIFTASSGQRKHPEFRLVFDIATDFLTVLDSSTKGFRDLKTSSYTAVELYTIVWKYDGERYQKSECTITDLNEKVRVVMCE